MLAHGTADAHAPLPGHLPLASQDDLDQFRVEGTMPVRAMIRELVNAQVQVAIHSDDQAQLPLLVRIDGIDAEAIDLSVASEAQASLAAFLQVPPYTLVGITGAVKIQLPLDHLALHHGSQGVHLQAPIPTHGWRVQRRDAYRVNPPDDDQAEVIIRLAEAHEGHGRLHDISAGGLCFYWPDSLPLPAVGETLRHCRIERRRAPALPCDLKIIRTAPADLAGYHLVSSRFLSLPESVSRQIQVYVMDVERRIRNARLTD